MSLSRLNYIGFWSGLLKNVLREEQFPAIVVLFTEDAYLIKLLHILEIIYFQVIIMQMYTF